MTFTVCTAEQRTPEWFQARLGRVTASRASDVLATLKSGKEAAGRRNYRIQLVLERLTGKSQESGFVSGAMQQGIDREPDARLAYEAATGQLVEQSGFLAADDLPIGCSLDGAMGDFERIVEFKCPQPAAHLEYLTTRKVPQDYLAQITQQLWITGAPICDFVSWNPDFPEPLQLLILPVERDEKAIDSYHLAVELFLREVAEEQARVEGLMGAVA